MQYGEMRASWRLSKEVEADEIDTSDREKERECVFVCVRVKEKNGGK